MGIVTLNAMNLFRSLEGKVNYRPVRFDVQEFKKEKNLMQVKWERKFAQLCLGAYPVTPPLFHLSKRDDFETVDINHQLLGLFKRTGNDRPAGIQDRSI